MQLPVLHGRVEANATATATADFFIEIHAIFVD